MQTIPSFQKDHDKLQKGLYAMTEWLKAYTERVEVGWLQGVAVLAVVVLIVVAVVLWQVRRVMGDNPADVVRSE